MPLDPEDRALLADFQRGYTVAARLDHFIGDLIDHLAERLQAVDPDRRCSSVDLRSELDRLRDASEDIDVALSRITDGLAEILPAFARFKRWRDLHRLVDPVPGQPDGYPPGALQRHGLGPYRRRRTMRGAAAGSIRVTTMRGS